MESATTACRRKYGGKESLCVWNLWKRMCIFKRFEEAWHSQAYPRRYIQNRRKTKENCFTNFTDQSVWRNCKRMCQVMSWRFMFFAWRHKKENSKVKNPFRRFWIRPVISSHVCEFMDDVFDKLKKACLLFDDQNLIPTFFSEAENSFWRFRKSDRVETWKCAKKNTVNL